MDFLSIRKKARERAGAKEGAAQPAPGAQSPAPAPAPGSPDEASRAAATEPGPLPEPPPEAARPEERRRARGGERVLTEEDLVEGALQARFRGLSPAEDGRFATWRPGSSAPPVEPDPSRFESPEAPDRETDAPAAATQPAPPAERSRPPEAPARLDPLDLFFYRPDEEAALVPLLGGGSTEEPVAAPPTVIEEYLTFRLGREEYGLPIAQVREVMRAPTITEVPRAPAHVLGIVTVRGEVVVVVDARARLGLGPGAADGTRIVIADGGEGPLGLLVEAIASVVRLPRGSIEPCPQGISVAASDCVTGIGRWKDRLFMVIDVGMMVSRPRGAEER